MNCRPVANVNSNHLLKILHNKKSSVDNNVYGALIDYDSVLFNILAGTRKAVDIKGKNSSRSCYVSPFFISFLP